MTATVLGANILHDLDDFPGRIFAVKQAPLGGEQDDSFRQGGMKRLLSSRVVATQIFVHLESPPKFGEDSPILTHIFSDELKPPTRSWFRVGGSLQNARKVSLQNASKKRKRITMVFDTCSIYCTCFSVSDGCSGFSVDVTCLDRAHMSHATGELTVNVHACSRVRTCNGF